MKTRYTTRDRYSLKIRLEVEFQFEFMKVREDLREITVRISKKVPLENLKNIWRTVTTNKVRKDHHQTESHLLSRKVLSKKGMKSSKLRSQL